MGGFDAILKFINFEVKDSKGNFYKACPLTLIMKSLNPFTKVLAEAEKGFML